MARLIGGGDPRRPPSTAQSFFQSQIPCPHQMSYIQKPYFIYTCSHKQLPELGGSIATEPWTTHRTATTLFEAPSQIKGEQAPPISVVSWICISIQHAILLGKQKKNWSDAGTLRKCKEHSLEDKENEQPSKKCTTKKKKDIPQVKSCTTISDSSGSDEDSTDDK